MKLPPHKCSLHITHNQHKDYYDSIVEYVRHLDDEDLSPVERAACIATGEIWEIQWYPHTPVESYKVCASTLERALELANAGGKP